MERMEIVDLKWIPEEGQRYFYPVFELNNFEFITNNRVYYNCGADYILKDMGHMFKSKEECQTLCDKLNEAINSIRQ